MRERCLMCKFNGEHGVCENEWSDYFMDYVDVNFVCDNFENVEEE